MKASAPGMYVIITVIFFALCIFSLKKAGVISAIILLIPILCFIIKI